MLVLANVHHALEPQAKVSTLLGVPVETLLLVATRYCPLTGTFDTLQMNQLLHIDVRKMKLVKIIKFHYFINEMTWNPEGTNVFLCTGGGDIEVRSWPDFVVCMIPVAVLTVKKVKTINAHTTSLFSISTNPNGLFSVPCF